MNTFNLLTIGDCNTFPDHLVQPEEQLPVRVQRGLEKHLETTVALTNIGQGMYTVREGLARLKNTPVISDFVIINFGLVDAWVTTIPRLYISYYPLTLTRKYLLKILKIIKKRLRYIPKMPRGNVVPQDEYRQKIVEMIKLCRRRNEGVKILLWATPFVQNHDARNKSIMQYNRVLKEIAERYDCLFCNSPDIVRAGNTQNYLDNVHLSGVATKALGTEITNLFNQ